MLLDGSELVDTVKVSVLLRHDHFPLVLWGRLDDLVLCWLEDAAVHGTEVVAEVASGEDGWTTVRLLIDWLGGLRLSPCLFCTLHATSGLCFLRYDTNLDETVFNFC